MLLLLLQLNSAQQSVASIKVTIIALSIFFCNFALELGYLSEESLLFYVT
jgi:hypothetical protein